MSKEQEDSLFHDEQENIAIKFRTYHFPSKARTTAAVASRTSTIDPAPFTMAGFAAALFAANSNAVSSPPLGPPP